MGNFTKVAKTTTKVINNAASAVVEHSPEVVKEAGKGFFGKCFGVLKKPVIAIGGGITLVAATGYGIYKYTKGKKAEATQTQPAGTDFPPVEEQPKPAQK